MRWPRALAAVGLVLAACSGDDGSDAGPRPVERPTRTVVDYSGVQLAGVPGTTTTTIREQGSASLVGTVAGPTGLVPGAIVRIERLVGGGEVQTDVATGPDGRFELRGVPGGRYRLRAFLPPALALTTPEVRFLRDGQEHQFDLVMTDQRSILARAAVAPAAPLLGDDLNLAVLVATRAVDGDGVVRSTPVPGLRVELRGLGAWTLREAPVERSPFDPGTTTTTFFAPPASTAVTDSQGQARFALRCARPGAPGLALLVTVTVTPAPVEGEPPPLPEQRVERLPLELPACVDPGTAVDPVDPADPTSPTTADAPTDGDG